MTAKKHAVGCDHAMISLKYIRACQSDGDSRFACNSSILNTDHCGWILDLRQITLEERIQEWRWCINHCKTLRVWVHGTASFDHGIDESEGVDACFTRKMNPTDPKRNQLRYLKKKPLRLRYQPAHSPCISESCRASKSVRPSTPRLRQSRCGSVSGRFCVTQEKKKKPGKQSELDFKISGMGRISNQH